MTEQGVGVVRPLPGEGLVAHLNGLLLVCAAGDHPVEELLRALSETATTGGDGRALARRTAQVLARAMDRSISGEPVACAVAGPAGGGVAVLVSGAAFATVSGPDGDVRLAGRDALTWTDRLVNGPVSRIELRLPGAGPASPYARLDGGVVGGAGLECDYTQTGEVAFPPLPPWSPQAQHQAGQPPYGGLEPIAPRGPVVPPPPPPLPPGPVSGPHAEPVPAPPYSPYAPPYPSQHAQPLPPPGPGFSTDPSLSMPSGSGHPQQVHDPLGPASVPDPVSGTGSGPYPAQDAVQDQPQDPPQEEERPFGEDRPAGEDQGQRQELGGLPFDPQPFESAPPFEPQSFEPQSFEPQSFEPQSFDPQPFEPGTSAADEDKGEPTQLDAAPAPESRPMVYGVDCKNDHFNDPRAPYCAICGIPIDQRAVVPYKGPRPQLGALLLDDGVTLPLDGDYLLGRDPERAPEVQSGEARPARVTSPDGSVSRRHLRVFVENWDVNLLDLGSVNGTQIQPPGDPNFYDIPPKEPVPILPGTTVRIGVSRTMRYEGHRSA